MFRSIATLTLLIAQAMSWVGGPQLRCVDNAGRIDVHGAAQSCHCRAGQLGPSTADRCEGHDHHEAAQGERLSISTGGCDCSHELIVGDGGVNVSRSTEFAALDDARQMAAPFALPVDALAGGHAPLQLAMGSGGPPAPPLILSSPVALRC